MGYKEAGVSHIAPLSKVVFTSGSYMPLQHIHGM